jgi:hypothetical protein
LDAVGRSFRIPREFWTRATDQILECIQRLVRSLRFAGWKLEQ